MPTGQQIRAARALLGITADELASLSTVTLRTIQRFEKAEGVPASRGGTLSRIKAALETEGIEFLGDPISSPGVMLHRKQD